jgi:hypothetical protein
MYVQVTLKLKLRPAAQPPRQAVPMGRTESVGICVNTPACEKGAGKNHYAVSMGQNGPVCASTSHTPSSSSRIT